MELIVHNTGELLFRSDTTEISYPRTAGNQLILCARMNGWDRFTALWEKRTKPEAWQKLRADFSTIDTKTKWKIKEAFARLETVDEAPAESLESDVITQVTL